MPGGALLSSGVVVGCCRSVARCFSCGYCLALPCLLRASRAVFPPASLAGLFAIRSALSSYRSAPRSFDKWDGSIAVCVSVWVRLGCCCLLLAVAVPWMRRGGVSLVGVARCRRVDGVGRRRDFCRSRCLPWAFLSVWRVSLVPVACFAPRCRRGSSWADRHRALSSWLRLVVGRRGSSPFRLACPRGSSSFVFATWGILR